MKTTLLTVLALLALPAAAHAATQVTGSLYDDRAEDGVIYLIPDGTSDMITLQMSNTKANQFAGIDGTMRVVITGDWDKTSPNGTANADGNILFNVDARKPFVFAATPAKVNGAKTPNALKLSPDETVRAKFLSKKPTSVKKLIWAVAKFTGSGSSVNVLSWSNVSRAQQTRWKQQYDAAKAAAANGGFHH